LAISKALIPYLEDLEARLDPLQEERLLKSWSVFSEQGCQSPIFNPARQCPSPPSLDWPVVSVNAALEDFDQMALQQFGAVSDLLSRAGGNLPAVRCNYGSSILPSLFGVEMFIMDDALNTLPTSRPLNDLGAVQDLLERGGPSPESGWGLRTLRMGEIYAEIAQKYPKIGRWVFIYHPDIQGPMDVCEVIWGSSLFYALYDRPDLVKALLDLVTETYIRFLRAWCQIVPFPSGGSCHWGFFHKGAIMLRDDSAMNLSCPMFDEFILPYDQRLLDEFGGGAIHFCGKGDHYIPSMTSLRGLNAINMSQPLLNNMEKIYSHTIDRGIRLIGLDGAAARQSHKAGRDLRGLVHVL
jgi:hypothetical protein